MRHVCGAAVSVQTRVVERFSIRSAYLRSQHDDLQLEMEDEVEVKIEVPVEPQPETRPVVLLSSLPIATMVPISFIHTGPYRSGQIRTRLTIRIHFEALQLTYQVRASRRHCR